MQYSSYSADKRWWISRILEFSANKTPICSTLLASVSNIGRTHFSLRFFSVQRRRNYVNLEHFYCTFILYPTYKQQYCQILIFIWLPLTQKIKIWIIYLSIVFAILSYQSSTHKLLLVEYSLIHHLESQLYGYVDQSVCLFYCRTL